MIPIFVRFVAKRRHRNALLVVTIICVQIASGIFVILMSLSSHTFISVCHMDVYRGVHIYGNKIWNMLWKVLTLVQWHPVGFGKVAGTPPF